MNTRSIALMTIILILATAITFVKLRVDQLDVGYTISENTKREKSLVQERQKLRAELSNLQSPHKLEIIANNLGFKYPSQNDIFYMERATIVSHRK